MIAVSISLGKIGAYQISLSEKLACKLRGRLSGRQVAVTHCQSLTSRLGRAGMLCLMEVFPHKGLWLATEYADEDHF